MGEWLASYGWIFVVIVIGVIAAVQVAKGNVYDDDDSQDWGV